MTVISVLLLAVNVWTFCLMGLDKRLAQLGRRRIPEKRLLQAEGLFGALGAYLGMRVFRHKTLHPKFSRGLPAMLLAQLAVLAAGLHYGS